MRKLLCLLLLVALNASAATTLTEFYCDASVSANNTNVNAGSTTGAPVYTSVNGNWDGTSVFTPTDGSTPADTISAGMWMSVYVDGATNLTQTGSGGWICLITNVAAGANGAITIDRRAFAGTAPSSSATGRSVRVGGCWKGPYAGISFPVGFMVNSATNAAGSIIRINMKGGTDYNITAALITGSGAGPIWYRGYTNTPGDMGKARIIGPNSGTGFTLFTSGGTLCTLSDLEFATNGTSGTAQGVSTSGARFLAERVLVHDVRNWGFTIGAAGTVAECEAYRCNTSATSANGGMSGGTTVNFRHCQSHHNTGNGIVIGDGLIQNCIAYNNSGHGVQHTGGSPTINTLDCYSNQMSGLSLASTTLGQQITVLNSSFVKNAGMGITNSGLSAFVCSIKNCGFGTGTATNVLGSIDSSVMNYAITNNLVLYPADATPWTDPDNGNFAIALSSAKSVGFGSFPNGITVGYPDIGAAQASDTNSAAVSGGSYTFAQ